MNDLKQEAIKQIKDFFNNPIEFVLFKLLPIAIAISIVKFMIIEII